MLRKYWVGTGVAAGQDVGIELQGHILTIEPSGALTVWREIDDAPSVLVMAFASGQWTKAHVVE